LMRCRREGLGVCQGAAAPVTLVGGCTSPTVIAAQGGTFTGTTSGTNLLTGSCGSSETSPEKVFQWTPTVSGTATIQTCGAGTSFRTEGIGVCQGAAAPVTLVGGCSSPTVIAAQGGTFSGTTSGTSMLAGSCGSSASSPERVFQWTPVVSGTATIQTCGAGTTFDTVLYMRSGACASGSQVSSGCND